MTIRVVELLVLLMAITFVTASKSLDKTDKLSRQQIMKLLSLPQKPGEVPNGFEVKLNGKLFIGTFKWTSCNASAPLKLNSLTISPDPIKLQGDITVGFNATVGVDVGAGLNAKVVIKKKISFLPPVEIPCEDNVGSCTYDDVCGMIPPTPPAGCPPPLSTYKLPCSCPVTKGIYSLPATTITIPPLPIPGWLASGDYTVGVKAYDKSGVNLACYDFDFSLASSDY